MPNSTRLACPYCTRTRGSDVELFEHLTVWHGLCHRDAIHVLARYPGPYSPFVAVPLDERFTPLTQGVLAL